MSAFPIDFWGPPGEEFNTYAMPTGGIAKISERYILGTRMRLKDGRVFRFAGNDGTVDIAGDLYTAVPPTANHLSLSVQADTAVAATSVPVTLGATAVTINQYKDSFLVFEDSAGTGIGYLYPIGAHAAVASAGTFTVPFRAPYTLQVAVTTATQATLVPHPWDNVILSPTTHDAPAVGVAVKPVAADYYGWYQTEGVAAVLEQGTNVVGKMVIQSTTTAGAIGPFAEGANAADEAVVGVSIRPVGDGKIGIVKLKII